MLPCWQAGKADIALPWLVDLINLRHKVVNNRLQLSTKRVQNVFFSGPDQIKRMRCDYRYQSIRSIFVAIFVKYLDWCISITKLWQNEQLIYRWRKIIAILHYVLCKLEEIHVLKAITCINLRTVCTLFHFFFASESLSLNYCKHIMSIMHVQWCTVHVKPIHGIKRKYVQGEYPITLVPSASNKFWPWRRWKNNVKTNGNKLPPILEKILNSNMTWFFFPY